MEKRLEVAKVRLSLTWSLRRNRSKAGLPTDRILLRSRWTRASGRPSEPVVGVTVTSPSPASSKTLRITNRACMWACQSRGKEVTCSPCLEQDAKLVNMFNKAVRLSVVTAHVESLFTFLPTPLPSTSPRLFAGAGCESRAWCPMTPQHLPQLLMLQTAVSPGVPSLQRPRGLSFPIFVFVLFELRQGFSV